MLYGFLGGREGLYISRYEIFTQVLGVSFYILFSRIKTLVVLQVDREGGEEYFLSPPDQGKKSVVPAPYSRIVPRF